MGLSQQVAYSSLLAIFPALAGLIGFLGVFHLYGPVLNALEGTVPHSVITFVRSIRSDSRGSATTAAFTIGLIGALWAASGATAAVIKAVTAHTSGRRRDPSGRYAGSRSFSSC